MCRRGVLVCALLGLACGCSGIEIVTGPAPPFLALSRVTDVPEDETEVTTTVGHTLHLPAGEGPELDLDAWRVTVNGAAMHLPRFDASGLVSYVFRPEQPGMYRIEVRWKTSGDLIHLWKIAVTQ